MNIINTTNAWGIRGDFQCTGTLGTMPTVTFGGTVVIGEEETKEET